MSKLVNFKFIFSRNSVLGFQELGEAFKTVSRSALYGGMQENFDVKSKAPKEWTDMDDHIMQC